MKKYDTEYLEVKNDDSKNKDSQDQYITELKILENHDSF